MKFRDYINEMDNLDMLQMKMDKINKKLPMMGKMIERATNFKVNKIYQGDLESDPGLDMGEYSISIPDEKHMVLTQYTKGKFIMKHTGDLLSMIDYLKKL